MATTPLLRPAPSNQFATPPPVSPRSSSPRSSGTPMPPLCPHPLDSLLDLPHVRPSVLRIAGHQRQPPPARPAPPGLPDTLRDRRHLCPLPRMSGEGWSGCLLISTDIMHQRIKQPAQVPQRPIHPRILRHDEPGPIRRGGPRRIQRPPVEHRRHQPAELRRADPNVGTLRRQRHAHHVPHDHRHHFARLPFSRISTSTPSTSACSASHRPNLRHSTNRNIPTSANNSSTGASVFVTNSSRSSRSARTTSCDITIRVP